LWASFAYLVLQPADRAPGALAAILSRLRAGEPGWVGAMDGALSHALAHLGTPASLAIAALCEVAAVTVVLGRWTRLGVTTAIILGAVIWIAEDFGGIFTGQGTDPNSGLLLIVVAAAFWPVAAPRYPRQRCGPDSPQALSSRAGPSSPPPGSLAAGPSRTDQVAPAWYSYRTLRSDGGAWRQTLTSRSTKLLTQLIGCYSVATVRLLLVGGCHGFS
jgi:hypothetical protein